VYLAFPFSFRLMLGRRRALASPTRARSRSVEKAARLRLVWAQANLRMVRPKTGFNGFFFVLGQFGLG
jgi:hypothetical protein